MIQITDLDLNAIHSKVNEIISDINSGNWVITYNKQQVALDFNGEAHLEILGYSFTRTMGTPTPDDFDSDPYYQAQNHIFDQIRQMIADFMRTTEHVYTVHVRANECNNMVYLTENLDYINLDFADDSITITLYLSGQY